MIKKIVFLFVLLGCLQAEENSIVAQVNQAEAEGYWKAHHFAAVGYRFDRQQFQTETTQTSYTDRNSLQLLLGSHLELYDCVINFRGAYGWLIDGNCDFTSNGQLFKPYRLGAGYLADAMLELGYRFKLFDISSIGFSLIPSGGYSYFHLMNFVKGERQVDSVLCRFLAPNQQDWFGPLAEGRLELRFWQFADWSFFYRYHWLSLCSKSDVKVGDVRTISLMKESNLGRQLFGTDFRYRMISGWNFGVHFEASKVNRAGVVKWIYYESDFSFGYQF